MRTRDEIEAALQIAGWCLASTPKRVDGGWKATIQRGPACVSMTAPTEIDVLEDLLLYAQAKGGR